MNTNMNTAPQRQEIEELLPWHAAGTLSRRDAQRVGQALASDPELARQFELVSAELSETIHLNETLGAPSARAMNKLMAGIEAESGVARQAKPSFSFSTWVAEKLSSFSPRTLAYSATAAALAICLQFGVLTGVAVNTALKPASEYQTASGHPTTAPLTGSFALISFTPNAQMSDITGFLEKHKAMVVDGPRPGGLYRVRLAATALPRTEVDTIIARMREDGALVRFVAPTE
jgi:hypothetical protein